MQVSGEFLNFFATGMFQAQQLLATGNAVFQVSSGLQSGGDTGSDIVLSSQAAAGQSEVTVNAALTTTTSNLSVGGTLASENFSVDSGGNGTFGGGLLPASLLSGLPGPPRWVLEQKSAKSPK